MPLWHIVGQNTTQKVAFWSFIFKYNRRPNFPTKREIFTSSKIKKTNTLGSECSNLTYLKQFYDQSKNINHKLPINTTWFYTLSQQQDRKSLRDFLVFLDLFGEFDPSDECSRRERRECEKEERKQKEVTLEEINSLNFGLCFFVVTWYRNRQ